MMRIALKGGPSDGVEMEVADNAVGIRSFNPAGMYFPRTQTFDSWEQGQASLELFGDVMHSRRDDGVVVFDWFPWK